MSLSARIQELKEQVMLVTSKGTVIDNVSFEVLLKHIIEKIDDLEEIGVPSTDLKYRNMSDDYRQWFTNQVVDIYNLAHQIQDLTIQGSDS